jgi:hypothetical protein
VTRCAQNASDSPHDDLVLFAGCIIAIPVVAGRGHYGWAAVLIGFVLVECGVLGANRSRCPLMGLGARHTEQRSANFDIYLPLWLKARELRTSSSAACASQMSDGMRLSRAAKEPSHK